MYSCLIFPVDKSKDYINASDQQQTESSCSVTSPDPDLPAFSSSHPAWSGSTNCLSAFELMFCCTADDN